jgi:enoyl-[acyl-carrier protein] reductase I
MADLMLGKCVLVTGARNKWSIAWHTALSLFREGAQVAFSVYGDREEAGVTKLLGDAGMSAPIFQCDATVDAQVERVMQQAADCFGGKLDGLVHAIAFANREDLAGEFVTTSHDGFLRAHENSVYSLVSLTRGARPLMLAAGGGSVVALSYLGAERVVPNYNVMGVAKAALEASVRYLASDLGREGIRVNAVSAAPIKTLAAGGIAGFDGMLKHVAERAPLGLIGADEVGDAAMFLLSSLSRGMTGGVMYVDGGYNILGLA